MEPERRCGKPCQQRFLREPCCPNRCQRPLGHGEGIALPAALGHLEHCNCLADHQPIQRVTPTHRLGDKCHHVHSWRQGTVIELPEGTHMRIEFDRQQKKDCWLGWSGANDGATELRQKHRLTPGENPLPNVYWLPESREWSIPAESAWPRFVNVMLERLRLETHWHFCGATTFGVVSVCH